MTFFFNFQKYQKKKKTHYWLLQSTMLWLHFFLGQTYIIFLAKLLTPHFSPGPESSECRLFALDDIPYESLSFSSMLVTLNLVCFLVVVVCVFCFHLGNFNGFFLSYCLCSTLKILRLENRSFTMGSSTRGTFWILRFCYWNCIYGR